MATDSLWYLAATSLCPPMESTRKTGWIEGFVAALDVLHERPDVYDALRESLAPEVLVPVGGGG